MAKKKIDKQDKSFENHSISQERELIVHYLFEIMMGMKENCDLNFIFELTDKLQILIKDKVCDNKTRIPYEAIKITLNKLSSLNYMPSFSETDDEPVILLEVSDMLTKMMDSNSLFKLFGRWQAMKIANAILEIAYLIENNGKENTIKNKVFNLRKAIDYTIENPPILLCEEYKQISQEYYNVLLEANKEIQPYYQFNYPKLNIRERVVKLRNLSLEIQDFVGYFNEICMELENATNEIRHIANDIIHLSDIDTDFKLRVFLLSNFHHISYDFERWTVLTQDETQVKSYLSQIDIILNNVTCWDNWPKNIEDQQKYKKQIGEDLNYFADQLDKSQVIQQYLNFSALLKGNNISTIPENNNEQNHDKLQSHSRASKEKLVRIEVAIKRLNISHSRVKQAAKNGEIYSKRSGKAKNSPYLVFQSEVEEKFGPHGEK